MDEENLKYTVTEEDAVKFSSFVDKGWKRFEEKYKDRGYIYGKGYSVGYAVGTIQSIMNESFDESLHELSSRIHQLRLKYLQNDTNILMTDRIYKRHKIKGTSIDINPIIFLLLLNEDEQKQLENILAERKANKEEKEEKTE